MISGLIEIFSSLEESILIASGEFEQLFVDLVLYYTVEIVKVNKFYTGEKV